MTTKDFVQYLNNHSEICEKLATCTAPEEAYAIAKAEGVTDTLEEFIAEMTRVKEAAQLSEEDLDKISAAGAGTVASNAAMAVSLIASSSVLAASITFAAYAI